MAGDIAISHERMQSEATNLTNTRIQFENDLSALRSKIEQLVNDGFVTKGASASFAAAHQRWNTAATDCVEELNLMSQYLAKTSEAFANVDQQFKIT